jgi:group I intron endonuclease
MKILGTLNMLAGIYKITNTKDGKSYIGQAVKLLSRYWKHVSTLRLQKHRNPHLQAAINKFGIENFTFEVLEVLPLDKSLLKQREQYWIDYYNTCNNKFGYNMASATEGHLGMKRSAETKKKLSLKRRERQVLSEDHKRSIGAGVREFNEAHPELRNHGIEKAISIAADLHRGKPLPEEHKNLIKLGMKKVIAEKGPEEVKRLQEISKIGSQTRAIEIHEVAKKKLNLTPEEEIEYETIYKQDKPKKEIWNDRKNFVRALERKRKLLSKGE